MYHRFPLKQKKENKFTLSFLVFLCGHSFLTQEFLFRKLPLPKSEFASIRILPFHNVQALEIELIRMHDFQGRIKA